MVGAGGFERTAAYNIARLTVRFLLHCIERLATQLGAAGHADKAVDMEDLVHSSAAGAFTHHVLSTAGTAPWGVGEEGRMRTHSQISQVSQHLSVKQHIHKLVQRNHKITLIIEKRRHLIQVVLDLMTVILQCSTSFTLTENYR